MEEKDRLELKERMHNWKSSKLDFIAFIREKLDSSTISELSQVTGIPRPTLYYMLYGRSGKKSDDVTS